MESGKILKEKIRGFGLVFLLSENEKRLNKLSPLKKAKEDRLSVYKSVKDAHANSYEQSALHVLALFVRSNELKLQDVTSVLALDYYVMKLKNCCRLPENEVTFIRTATVY